MTCANIQLLLNCITLCVCVSGGVFVRAGVWVGGVVVRGGVFQGVRIVDKC